MRVEPGGDQLQDVPGGHGQGTKSKRHNHDNHGEDQVGEVRRGVEDLAQGDVQVPGHDHHPARVGLWLDEIVPSCRGRRQLSSKLQLFFICLMTVFEDKQPREMR